MKWKLFDFDDFTQGWEDKPFLRWIKNLFTPGGYGDSYLNKTTGAHLTGAENEANAFTAQQAQLNRDWQTQMDNTKYQRTVADMQAAGVNPALAMSNGAGSTPSGSAGSSVAPGSGSLSDIIQLMLIKPQRDLIRAQSKQARDLGEAALRNAGANEQNASSNERNAATNERNATVNELLARNTIRLGDNTVKLSEKQMESISQEILESQSRVSLQECEKACKELGLRFDTEMYDTNKAALLQSIAYKAVEMSHLRQMDKESLQRISYMSAEEAGIAWQREHPKLASFVGAGSALTGIIGNVFKGSAGAFVSKVVK